MGTCINNQALSESMPNNFSLQYVKLTQVYAKQSINEIKEQVTAFKQMQKMVLPQQIQLPDWKINQNYEIEKQQLVGEEILYQGYDCISDGQQYTLNQITLQPKQFMICQAFAQQPLKIISQFDSNLSGCIQWRGLKLYNLGNSDYFNEHFNDELKGDYIIQINVNQENSLNQLLQDFRLGFNPLSYNSLRTHVKRRGLKQKHLWVFFRQLQNSQVACNLFIELIENISQPIDELIKNIVQGFSVNHYQRLACLHDFNLNKEDQRYLCSSQIVMDVTQLALSHPVVLVRSLQQRFGIQIKREYLIKMTENVNYFICSDFISNCKFIEKTNTIYQQLRQRDPHQSLIDNKQKSGYEIYLPLIYYNYNYRYFIQDDSTIVNIINQKNISEDERNRYKLLQMILNKQSYTIETNNKAHQLLNLMITLLYDKTNNYDTLISFTQKCFGDQNNRSSIKHNIISYVVEKQNQTGYNIKEWLLKRYNDLIDEQLDFIYINTNQQSEILVWGLNDAYQLAQPLQQVYKIPQALQIQISFTDITCGYKHTLALSVFKNVYCWGCNEYGKCGVLNQKYVKSPEKIQNFDNIIQICAGYDHSCLLQENGQVYCWGHGDGGLIGNSQQVDSHTPEKTLIEGPVQKIISGGLHNTAISDGFVYQWGRGEAGQLGQHIEYQVTPFKHQLQNIIDIASGESHNLALDINGNVWGWGNGEYGQLVIETQCQLEPAIIFKDAQKIFASSLFSYFVKNNTLYGCGNDFSDKRLLREIATIDIKQLCGSQNHIIYSTEIGLYGWGLNRYGELAQTSGLKVEKILNQETQSISCGGYHTAVITGKQNDHRPKLKRTKSIQL